MANDHEWPVIYAYTRKQAIEDGVLIDVTEQARQTGFRIPVAVTDHLFHGYIEPPDGLDTHTFTAIFSSVLKSNQLYNNIHLLDANADALASGLRSDASVTIVFTTPP